MDKTHERGNMETVELKIGAVVGLKNGALEDRRRPVVFEGEKLGEGGWHDDVRLTLYMTADGRVVVYIEARSHSQGGPFSCALRAVTLEGLGIDIGVDELLGRVAGMGRALTLDEALSGGTEK